MQAAFDISSSTAAFNGKNAFNDWITNAGFYRVNIVCCINPSVAGAESTTFINDGSTSSVVFSTGPSFGGGTSVEEYVVSPEFTVFLRPGDVLRTNHPSATADVVTTLAFRRVADLYGNLSQPTGFTFQ